MHFPSYAGGNNDMTENIDDLIARSQSIRDDLLKTIGKLEAFSAALIKQAGRLQTEVTTYARDHEVDTQSTSAFDQGTEVGNANAERRDPKD
jgi:hypothetical protein